MKVKVGGAQNKRFIFVKVITLCSKIALTHKNPRDANLINYFLNLMTINSCVLALACITHVSILFWARKAAKCCAGKRSCATSHRRTLSLNNTELDSCS